MQGAAADSFVSFWPEDRIQDADDGVEVDEPKSRAKVRTGAGITSCLLHLGILLEGRSGRLPMRQGP